MIVALRYVTQLLLIHWKKDVVNDLKHMSGTVVGGMTVANKPPC